MQQLIQKIICGNTFVLSSERCIYWEEEKTLILSDLHLGKTGHFRKEGIAVPQAILKEDLQRFVSLIQQFKPERIFVIGDMFHSRANKELDFFLKWRNDFSTVSMELIRGNHDILSSDWYRTAGINMVHGQLNIGNFVFSHDWNDCSLTDTQYAFSGHIHPGFSIRGIGRQSLRFPCFFFGRQHAVLPAFSRFTGTYSMQQKKGDAVYAIIPADSHRGAPGGMIMV